MAKAEVSVEELVGMIERGELRLPEMQRRYVWRSTRVRDLLDSLYRGYPSGAIRGEPVTVRGRKRPDVDELRDHISETSNKRDGGHWKRPTHAT